MFNVVIETQRQMDPPVNTVRAQSDLFTVQCCHSDSKADGPPQSTLSEHRVISLLFNVVIQTHRQVDSPQNTVRAQSDIFTVQCCHSDSEADEPLGQHYPRRGVISSLFSVVIQIQRQMDTPVNTVREQSDLFTVQCCHWDSKADGPPVNTVRAQSDLFTVQCCHSD